MVFRYNVCLEEYIDLSLRLKNSTTSQDIEPMRRTRKSGVKKMIKYYSHILFNTTEYKIGYNLALTKDSRAYYSKSIIYLAIKNIVELKMV